MKKKGTDMETMLVYMTAGSPGEAKKVGKALLEAKLVACVNVIDNMNSMYVWKGEVKDEKESVIIAKTTEEMLPELMEKVKSVHSYEIPCIVALPIKNGYPPFLHWVEQEVKR